MGHLRRVQVVAALAVWSGACATVLGVEQLREDVCGKFAYAEPACADCMRASCCGEAAACGADPSCTEAFGCRMACPVDDPSCRFDCLDPHEPVHDVSGVDACHRHACLDECLGLGGWEELFEGDATCGECLQRNCADDIRACLRDPACEGAVDCVTSCPDPSCIARCSAAFSILPPTLVGCVTGCAADCEFHESFECIDHYEWFGEEEGKVEVELRLADFTSGEPLGGATVRACKNTDCPRCLDPEWRGVAEDTTDSEGVVKLLVDGGFNGCFASLTSNHLPTLHYTPPIVEPRQFVGYSPLLVITYDLFHQVEEQLHIPIVEAMGHVGALQRDCRTSLDVEVDGMTFTPLGSEPQPMMPVPTSDSFVALNLDPGLGDVASTNDGKTVGRRSVAIVANAITSVVLYPRPTGE